MLTRKDFKGGGEPTWCKGCGNYGILNAVKMALAEQGIAPHQVVIFTGIGCGSKLPHYMKVSGFHTIHGRALAVATGARLANHSLKIMAIHGDGDGYGMGLGHWLHAVRRNIGLVDLVQNNRVYGLTRGQYSPTSDPGMVTPTSPEGAIDRPVPPLALAIAAGATFVARGYPGQLRHLAWLIGEALQHSGYALVDVLQLDSAGKIGYHVSSNTQATPWWTCSSRVSPSTGPAPTTSTSRVYTSWRRPTTT